MSKSIIITRYSHRDTNNIYYLQSSEIDIPIHPVKQIQFQNLKQTQQYLNIGLNKYWFYYCYCNPDWHEIVRRPIVLRQLVWSKTTCFWTIYFSNILRSNFKII